MIVHYFGKINFDPITDAGTKADLSQYEKKSMKQISIDVYRTQPDFKLFSCSPMQTMMVRILFHWTIRHPGSGYVQGINDLAAPLILVFLAEYQKEPYPENIYDITESNLKEMNEKDLISVEADTFWCLTKIIDDI